MAAATIPEVQEMFQMMMNDINGGLVTRVNTIEATLGTSRESVERTNGSVTADMIHLETMTETNRLACGEFEKILYNKFKEIHDDMTLKCYDVK